MDHGPEVILNMLKGKLRRDCQTTTASKATWLWTNGVNTNGAAAKAMGFDRLGKKVRPGTFGEIKVG